MTTEPTDADRATAHTLIDELTFGGHSWDGAAETVAQALADARAAGFDAGWTASQRQLVIDAEADR
jgi:hypothetical protein